MLYGGRSRGDFAIVARLFDVSSSSAFARALHEDRNECERPNDRRRTIRRASPNKAIRKRTSWLRPENGFSYGGTSRWAIFRGKARPVLLVSWISAL